MFPGIAALACQHCLREGYIFSVVRSVFELLCTVLSELLVTVLPYVLARTSRSPPRRQVETKAPGFFTDKQEDLDDPEEDDDWGTGALFLAASGFR